MITGHFILALLWIVYGFLHTFLAHSRVKNWFSRRMKNSFRYYRIFYSLFAFLFLLSIIYYQVTLSTRVLYELNGLVLISGIAITFSGIIIMAACIKKYITGLSGPGNVFFEHKSKHLIISGIHRYIRHPLYLGTFIFLWGLFMLLPYLSLLISNIIITLYTLIGMRFEEKKLVENFGEEYLEYRKRVPALIPTFRYKRKRSHS